MKITSSGPNNRTWYDYTLLKIMADDGTLIDSFQVPKYMAEKYCRNHPTGEYGKRYARAIRKCAEYEAA